MYSTGIGYFFFPCTLAAIPLCGTQGVEPDETGGVVLVIFDILEFVFSSAVYFLFA
jgi:hypothetical protein